MITLKISGAWFSAFFQERALWEPILIKQGLPEGAVFLAARHCDDINGQPGVLLDFNAPGPDKVMEAVLVNVEPAFSLKDGSRLRMH